MAARKSQTVLNLEAELRALEAYREAYSRLRAGETPVVLTSGEADPDEDNVGCRVELLGASRPSGGVVILEGGSVMYADAWTKEARGHCNPYVREVARLVERAQGDAVRERMARGGR